MPGTQRDVPPSNRIAEAERECLSMIQRMLLRVGSMARGEDFLAAHPDDKPEPEHTKTISSCDVCGRSDEPTPEPIEAGDLWQRDEDGTPVVIEAWDGDRVDFATIDDSGVGVLNTPSFRDTFTRRKFHRDREAPKI